MPTNVVQPGYTPADAVANAERQAKAVIRRARGAEQRLVKRITKHILEKEWNKAYYLCSVYLGSRSSRIYAVDRENQKLDRRRRKDARGHHGFDNRVSAVAVIAIADQLDLWQPSFEYVSCEELKKPSGGIRYVCAFGFGHKVRQAMVKRVLDCLTSRLHPRQYMLRGGVNAAIGDIGREITSRGFRCAAELDIKSCFGSFDEKKLPKLLPGIPERVVETSIVSTEMKLHHRTLPYNSKQPTNSLSKKFQQGLPQGSAASPYAAELLIALVLNEVSDGRLPASVLLVTYADNILVLGSAQDDVASACDVLTEAFKASAVGALELKTAGVKWLARGIDYLGYRIRSDGGSAIVRASSRNRDRIVRRVCSAARRKEPKLSIDRLARSWSASFKCDPTARHWLDQVVSAQHRDPLSTRMALQLSRYYAKSMLPSGRFSLAEVMFEMPRRLRPTKIRSSCIP
ncbi:reverse transcriptase domain-containing protein [Methylobacterium sp. A54F]